MPPIPDGSRWAADNAANNGANHAARSRISSDSIQRLVVLGYITAVAMPPVGLILGLLLAVRLDKAHSKRGMLIVAISVIAAVAWVLALVAGLLNPNSDTST
jgi:hypothetical protein